MHGMLQVTHDTLHLTSFFLFQKVPKMAKKALTSQNMKKCQKLTKNTKSAKKKLTKITKSAKKKALKFLEFQCFGDTIQPHEKCKCLPQAGFKKKLLHGKSGKEIFIYTFSVLLLMAQTSEHGRMQEAVRMVQFPRDLLNDPNFTQLRF